METGTRDGKRTNEYRHDRGRHALGLLALQKKSVPRSGRRGGHRVTIEVSGFPINGK